MMSQEEDLSPVTPNVNQQLSMNALIAPLKVLITKVDVSREMSVRFPTTLNARKHPALPEEVTTAPQRPLITRTE